MWPLEVGVLQGGWVKQQQEEEEEHPSGSSSSSSSSSRRARDTVGVLPGACARVWADRDRSPAQQPQRMPLASRGSSVVCSIRHG
eukprot:1687250-Prymnesium_polylepis.1